MKKLTREEKAIRARRVIDRSISYLLQFGDQSDLCHHVVDELAECKSLFPLDTPTEECEHPFKRLHWVDTTVFCNQCGATLNKQDDAMIKERSYSDIDKRVAGSYLGRKTMEMLDKPSIEPVINTNKLDAEEWWEENHSMFDDTSNGFEGIDKETFMRFAKTRNETVPNVGGEKRSCPCNYGEPCKPNCTCVNEFSSAGCDCCCTYGSIEQREAKAKYLKNQPQEKELFWKVCPACNSQNTMWWINHDAAYCHECKHHWIKKGE